MQQNSNTNNNKQPQLYCWDEEMKNNVGEVNEVQGNWRIDAVEAAKVAAAAA